MSPRVFIRQPTDDDWQDLMAMHQRSQSLHFPWASPPLTKQECKWYIRRCQSDDFEGLLICHVTQQSIVGVANLSQHLYKAFQSAYLGYYANADFAGQGLMTEGLRLVLNHAFGTLGLHRLEANIQPDNIASIKLAKRLGFTQEGVSARYLKIHGEWRDHKRWALMADDWTDDWTDD